MTEHMTPDDARRIYAGFKRGNGFSLLVEWCDALKALADDTFEYRVERQAMPDGVWHPITEWHPAWPYADTDATPHDDERIVCRRVSEPWVVADHE